MSLQQEPGTVYFFAPGVKHYQAQGFPTPNGRGLVPLSVTGSRCALNCRHCGATILRSMKAATTPSLLKEQALKAASRGAPGILISGGSLSDGTVPLEPFLPTIGEIKRELGLSVLIHTGLVTPRVADGLAQAGVDCAMLDFIGDPQTIRQVCGLEASVEDYARSLELLTSRDIPTAPHLIIGLHFGKLRGERQALEIMSSYPLKAVVLVGFRPIPGTPMAGVQPASPGEMGELFRRARTLFPQTPLLWGCERPLGPHREQTDLLALEAGVDGVAFPSDSAIQWARGRKLEIRFSWNCCAMIPPIGTVPPGQQEGER